MVSHSSSSLALLHLKLLQHALQPTQEAAAEAACAGASLLKYCSNGYSLHSAFCFNKCDTNYKRHGICVDLCTSFLVLHKAAIVPCIQWYPIF